MGNRSRPLNPVDWYRVPTGFLMPDNLVIFATSLLSIYSSKCLSDDSDGNVDMDVYASSNG
jgi:hypothetical protein